MSTVLMDSLTQLASRRDELQAELTRVEGLREELDTVERILDVAKPFQSQKATAKSPVTKPRARKVGKSKAKRSSAPSAQVMDRVLEALQTAFRQGNGDPVSLHNVRPLTDLHTDTVSRALGALAKQGRVQFLGFQPGVKGRRPLYAPQVEQTSGDGQNGAAASPSAPPEWERVRQTA